MFEFIKRLKRAYDYMENAEAELLREYTRGVNETVSTVKSQLSEAMGSINKISHDAVTTAQDLSESFRKGILDEEMRWKKKCDLCKKQVDADRRKMKMIQEDLLLAFTEFSSIYAKLFKHAAFVDSAHDTILNSTAQVKASKGMLENIRKEYTDFKERVTPLTEISIEDRYEEEREGTFNIGIKQRTKTADG